MQWLSPHLATNRCNRTSFVGTAGGKCPNSVGDHGTVGFMQQDGNACLLCCR